MENTNNQLSEKAFFLSQKAYKEQKYELARIYIVNAITHDTDVRYLKAMVTIVKKFPLQERRAVAEQALNILSMALFQVPPEQVEEVQSQIVELEGIYDETFSSIASKENDNGRKISSLGEMLQDYSWSKLRGNGTIEDFSTIQEKYKLLQQLVESESMTDSQKASVEHELQVCVSFMDFLTKHSVLEESFSGIESELSSGKNFFFIAAKLQNATTILAQLWLLDVSDVMPQSLLRKKLSEYAQKIEGYEASYNRLKSEPIHIKLSKMLAKALANAQQPCSGKRTTVINECQKTIQEVTAQLFELTAPELLRDIQNQIRKLAEQAEIVSKQRFAAYQSFCAEKCKSAIVGYDDIFARVSESDAKELLNKWEIAKIDESLLSPEASAIFHEAKGILMDKLSRIEKAEYQVKCVVSAKYKLEDF